MLYYYKLVGGINVVQNEKRNKIKISILVCLIIALVAVIALTLISFYWLKSSIWKSVIVTLLTTISSLAGVEAIWELISKRNFSEYIINEVHLSENLRESGIEYTYKDYSYIMWENELKDKTDLFAFFSHGHGWLKINKDITLTEFLKNKGKVTFCFANPFDAKLMEAYDKRFNYESGTTKKRIIDSLKILKQLGQDTKKSRNIKIRFFNGQSTMSYYFIGKHNIYDTCIGTLYNHSPNSGKAPALKIKKYVFNTKNVSVYFSFLEEELKWINNQSFECTESIDSLLEKL